MENQVNRSVTAQVLPHWCRVSGSLLNHDCLWRDGVRKFALAIGKTRRLRCGAYLSTSYLYLLSFVAFQLCMLVPMVPLAAQKQFDLELVGTVLRRDIGFDVHGAALH